MKNWHLVAAIGVVIVVAVAATYLYVKKGAGSIASRVRNILA